MNMEERLKKLGTQMLDELYIASTPSLSWENVLKKYGGTKIKFYEKHVLDNKTSEKILDKYKKKCKNKFEKDSLSWLWLDYAPVGNYNE